MKIYKVLVTETLAKEIETVACSKEEAEKSIMEIYLRGDLILTADDFASMALEVREEEK